MPCRSAPWAPGFATTLPRVGLGRDDRWSFWWRVDQPVSGPIVDAFLAMLGTPPSSYRRDKTILAAGVLLRNFWMALACAAERGTPVWTAINRTRAHHDWRVPFEPTMRLLDACVRKGVVVEHPGQPGDARRSGTATVYLPLPVFDELFATQAAALIHVDLGSFEAVQMRGVDGSWTDVPETEEVQEWCDVIHRLNAVNVRARWEVVRHGRPEPILPSDLLYQRKFARGRFECGGRLYAPVQNLRRHERMQLRVAGAPTVEADYKSLHPRMAYHAVGLVAPEDVYANAQPWVRDPHRARNINKAVLLVGLNAANKWQATGAIRSQIAGKGFGVYSLDRVATFLRTVKAHHAPIRSFFHSDVGVELQRRDSDIAFEVCRHFANKGVPCLPIHDSFRVPGTHLHELVWIMRDRYEWYMQAPCPVEIVGALP